MTDHEMTRRGWIARSAVGLAAISAVAKGGTAAADEAAGPFGYCLNTSTVAGHKLGIDAELKLAAEAGYQGVEPWVRELDAHAQAGKSLDDLGKRVKDLGLTIPSAIGFFDWAVDDDARRKKGLEEARRNMEVVRRIGGLRVAAPPTGLTDRTDVDPRRLADRYRTLLQLGETMGVVPQVEIWGFSKTLTTLGEAAQVALGADHPSACILADVYHLYKGGSGFHGVRLLNGAAMHVLHVNDYPADPPRDRIKDSDRVYPGDGVAPLPALLRDLRANGFRGMLSVELFNAAYYAQAPALVARTALEKTRAQVRAALAG